MSYARFAPDSDVYVFESALGLECCACLLRRGVSFACDTIDGMLAHLDEHQCAGHKVPNYCIDGLLYDRELREEPPP